MTNDTCALCRSPDLCEACERVRMMKDDSWHANYGPYPRKGREVMSYNILGDHIVRKVLK